MAAGTRGARNRTNTNKDEGAQAVEQPTTEATTTATTTAGTAATKFESEVKLFEPESGTPVFDEVQIRPKAGFKYLYEWAQETHKENWRSDGYRWKQNGKVQLTCGDVHCFKFYFKLRISPLAYSSEFAKTVITHPKYPNRALICYEGNDAVVVDFAHGNSKKPNKIIKPYHRTKPSLLRALKSVKGKAPTEAFNEFATVVSLNPDGTVRNVVDSPRDVKQLMNAKASAKQEERLWKEAVHTLSELHRETDFLSDVQIIPQLIILCYKNSTLEKFKNCLNRTDLPPSCLAVNTSFSMGKLCLSVVTFRQTEFEEAPVIPLLYMIHEEKTEAAYAFLFLRLNQLAPELLAQSASNQPVIFTNGEEEVVNALKRTLPNLPRFRCWIQAFRDMKYHLRNLGVTQREKLRVYKEEFVQLLTKESQTEYTYALVDMVLKWDKRFSVYFRTQIDPDMKQMGAWALQTAGLQLEMGKPSKALDTTLNRFNGWKKSPIDEMILSLLRIAEFFETKIIRAQYRQGAEAEADYTLRAHLHDLYDIEEPGVVVPEAVYDDDDDILLAAGLSNTSRPEPMPEAETIPEAN